MKKKIIFGTYNLDIGGIETALVSLLNNIDYSKYDVYLFLVKKEGIFLDQISKNVKIINFDICDSKNIIYRKFMNLCKLVYFTLRYNNKFDFSAAYGTSVKAVTRLMHHFSKNNALWIHGDFTLLFPERTKFANFLKFINYEKYKKHVFVANSIKSSFKKYRIDVSHNTYVFNNFIDADRINKLASEEKPKKSKITFINVSRHEELQKNLFMLFRVIKRLSDAGYDFDLWMIGDGVDHQRYIDYVNDNHLNRVVKFLGKKSNPFVYYKAADALLLSSTVEGNPVVFMEAKVLGLPIITTNVSDAMIDINGKYGIVTRIDEDDYYNGVKQFLDKGFKPIKFNPQEFNNEILKKLYMVIDE